MNSIFKHVTGITWHERSAKNEIQNWAKTLVSIERASKLKLKILKDLGLILYESWDISFWKNVYDVINPSYVHIFFYHGKRTRGEGLYTLLESPLPDMLWTWNLQQLLLMTKDYKKCHHHIRHVTLVYFTDQNAKFNISWSRSYLILKLISVINLDNRI